MAKIRGLTLAMTFKAIVIFLLLLIAALMVVVVVCGDIMVDSKIDVQFGGSEPNLNSILILL